VAQHGDKALIKRVMDGVYEPDCAYAEVVKQLQDREVRDAKWRRLKAEAPPLLLFRAEGGEGISLDEALAELDQIKQREEEAALGPVLAEHADAIKALGKRIIADLIEIGRRLCECKAILGHGNWLPWLEREFGWSDDTALNFMRAHELAKFRNFTDLSLPPSALYLLARPSTPETIRDEILARAETERLSHSEVKQLIDQSRGIKSATPLDELRKLIARMPDDDPLAEELREVLAKRIR
jgi:hypothetical protein